MTTHYSQGDALLADRIAVQAIDIDKIIVKKSRLVIESRVPSYVVLLSL